MRKVQLTETVLRDANQSLMATRLPYADYEDILPVMDQTGYYSIECWGGATFDSCLRYLHEDPWERLRKLRKNLPNNKLQMLLRGQNLLGYKHYHDDVVEKFIELSIKNGIDVIRIFDALNDIRDFHIPEFRYRTLHNMGEDLLISQQLLRKGVVTCLLLLSRQAERLREMCFRCVCVHRCISF